jgi:hypothetical protein
MNKTVMFLNSIFLSRIFASLMLISVMLLTLSGCEKQVAVTETITTPLEYRIIENGIEITGEKNNADYAAFYIPPEMVTHYGYEQLNKEEKKIYDTSKKDIGNFTETVLYDPSINGAKYSKLLDLLRIEELSYTHLMSKQTGEFVTSEAKYEVIFTYTLSPEEMTKRNIESEKAALDIISKMPRGLSDYEKVKYFHDWLILNVDKNTMEIDAMTIYGTLLRGIANCEGYTRTFSYLCNLSGIENLILTGLTDTRHMWNMVKLGGNWYHIDVTFDEPEETLAKEYPDFISYQHFLVNDDLILNDRIVWTNLFRAPVANAANDNYFTKEGKLIENDNMAKEVIENALTQAISEHKTYVSVKCSSTDVYLRTVENLSEYFESIYGNIEQNTGIKASFSTSNVYGGFRIICLFIDYQE